MKLATRLGQISASPTMMVMQAAADMRDRGCDVVDLGPGQPDFPTPDAVKLAGINAIKDNFTNYTPAAGTRELRQAIAESFNRAWNRDYDFSNVIVTCGAKHAIYNVCMAAFEKGDEVLIPAPYWVTFPEAVKLADGQPSFLKTKQEHAFVLRSQDIESAVSSKTRGLIVNTPNNPTGAMIPKEEISEILEMARSHDLMLLSDETYDRFTYPAEQHVSLASLVDQEEDNYAVVGSFSKTYSMTGWRIGYCLGPRGLIRRLADFQSHQSGNPPSIGQKAALAALAAGGTIFEPMRKEYESRRSLILSLLESIPGFYCTEPRGAFYAFPNVEECMKNLEFVSSADFAKHLIQEAHVATVPGSAFGFEGHLRLSYATSMENIETGLERIRERVTAG